MNTIDPLIWSGILMVLGLSLVMLEVFVPSGGVLGVLSVTSLAASIILAFYHHGSKVGLIFVGVTAVAVPTVLVFAFRWWPHTPMGKRLLLDVPSSEEVLPDSPLRRTLRQLVGKVGVAQTVMLPSGAVSIEGMTVDAMSQGMPIEAGQQVLVIEVQGNRVVVQPVGDMAEAPPSDDVLSQPLDKLGLDSLEDPLT